MRDQKRSQLSFQLMAVTKTPPPPHNWNEMFHIFHIICPPCIQSCHIIAPLLTSLRRPPSTPEFYWKFAIAAGENSNSSKCAASLLPRQIIMGFASNFFSSFCNLLLLMNWICLPDWLKEWIWRCVQFRWDVISIELAEN